jgi:collagen triple helix repeat protein
MATCDTLEADLSRTDYSVTFEQQPCIDAQILQSDITIQAVTLANQGPQGEAATIVVGTTTTTAPGSPASVVNVGTENDAIFNFAIPTGNAGPPGSQGLPGSAATIAAGTTTTTAPGTNATVTNSGTANAAVFDFGIPRGNVGPQGQGLTPKGTVANHAALPATGNTTGDLWVTADTGHGWSWNGTTWIDMGPFQGPAGAAGSQGPPGVPGSAGPAGTAATATAGTTVTGAPGTNANVTNVGTTSAAVFNFSIPRGDVGAAGTAGAQGPQGPQGPTGSQGPQGPAGSTGAQGPQGPTGSTGAPAWTTNTSGFTIPAVGSTVSVTVADASWIVVGEMLYVDQAGGGVGISGVLQVTAKAGNTLTLLNPQPAPAIPLASSAGAGLLARTSGNTTDFIDGTNTCQPIAPQIWSVRLRGYSSIGNGNFGVDQRNCFSSVTVPAGTGNWWGCDRWQVSKVAATGAGTIINSKQTPAVIAAPGTNFPISDSGLKFQVSIAQASLAAGEYVYLFQYIEGSAMREIIRDPHSISLLVSSTKTPLNFSVSLRDSPTTQSIVYLCTYNVAANTPQLLTIPNIPAFPTGSTNFNTNPGSLGYSLSMCLGAGTTFTTSGSGWNAGNFLAASGTDNLLATNGASFTLFFVQHEPGPQCTQLMDVPFSQSYDSCLRYYSKSYPYSIKAGTANIEGYEGWQVIGSSTKAYGCTRFPKPMAKSPTVSIWSYIGTPNGVSVMAGATPTPADWGATVGSVTERGVSRLDYTAVSAGVDQLIYQYAADTGW